MARQRAAHRRADLGRRALYDAEAPTGARTGT
jgi:hypothetical protein